jgi:hypothetical protein
MANKKDDTKKQEEQFIMCPCCGKTKIKKPVEIKSILMEQYMACMMTGTPFAHTYEMYDGKIKITVTMLTQDESDNLIQTRALLDLCAIKVDAEMDDVVKNLKGMLELYSQIDTITVKNDKNVKAFTPAATAKEICATLLKKRTEITTDKLEKEVLKDMLQDSYNTCKNTDLMSVVPPVILSTVRSTHDTLYSILVEAGFDPNFWKGIELA